MIIYFSLPHGLKDLVSLHVSIEILYNITMCEICSMHVRLLLYMLSVSLDVID